MLFDTKVPCTKTKQTTCKDLLFHFHFIMAVIYFKMVGYSIYVFKLEF